jgi:hypothetical protein
MSESRYIVCLILVAVIWFAVGVGVGYDMKCKAAICWALEAPDE